LFPALVSFTMSKVLISVVLFFGACYAVRDFGIWHCGDDGCDWSRKPNLEASSSWMLDRGDGKPTFTYVIFAFVDPLKLMKNTTDSGTVNGIPRGMTKDAISFFTSKNISVMFSIGGADAGSAWDSALQNPTQLAKNAAAAAREFQVGLEIDYESENSKSVTALGTFVKTYRSIIPATTKGTVGLLTVDLGSDLTWLIGEAKETADWIAAGEVQWKNAMVDTGIKNINEGESRWNQHLKGASGVPAVKPQELAVCLFENDGCSSYSTLLEDTVNWVKQNDVRGIFFWASGSSFAFSGATDCPGIRDASKALLG